MLNITDLSKCQVWVGISKLPAVWGEIRKLIREGLREGA